MFSLSPITLEFKIKEVLDSFIGTSKSLLGLGLTSQFGLLKKRGKDSSKLDIKGVSIIHRGAR